MKIKEQIQNKQIEDIFNEIVNNIPKNKFDEKFIRSSQALSKILTKVGKWNNRFKRGEVNFWICIFINIEERNIDGKYYTGFLIKFYDDRHF